MMAPAAANGALQQLQLHSPHQRQLRQPGLTARAPTISSTNIHKHSRESSSSSNSSVCRGAARRQQQQPSQRRATTTVAAAAAGSGGSAPQQPPQQQLSGIFADIMKGMAELAAFQQQQAAAAAATGSALAVQQLSYHPAGTPAPIVADASMYLPGNSMGVVFGRSGSGKTTLLALLSGLLQQTAGAVHVVKGGGPQPPALLAGAGLTCEQRRARVGLVFQFPERHFIGETIAEEITLTWPRGDLQELYGRQVVAGRVLEAVGLAGVPLDTPVRQLSDGYKRRVALAVQLCRQPDVLLLDEPLAGLDWRARADVTQLLGNLKQECTILVVSHDLRELAPLVDAAWRMQPGGVLAPSEWPLPG